MSTNMSTLAGSAFTFLVANGCAATAPAPASLLSARIPVPVSSETATRDANHALRESEGPARETAEREADAAFRSIHRQLLACYATRLTTHPNTHAYVTFDILVAEDGRPSDVGMTGGALLGDAAAGCMIGAVRRMAFAPRSRSGTSRIRVPFAFLVEKVQKEGSGP